MMMITFTNMVKEVVVMVVGEMQKFFKFASYISVHSNFDNDDDVSFYFFLFIIQTHSAEAGWRHCHYYYK